MEKINTITVNGVTYEIGGSGEGGGLGDSVYYISTEISKLASGASKNDVDTALGGTGDGAKLTELFNAIMAGKLILLKNGTTGALMPVITAADSTTAAYIQFFYPEKADDVSVFYTLFVSKIGSIIGVAFSKYRITAEKIEAS